MSNTVRLLAQTRRIQLAARSDLHWDAHSGAVQLCIPAQEWEPAALRIFLTITKRDAHSCARACAALQEMYSLADENDPESDLMPDEPITDGFEDDSDSEPLERWLVAPKHTRPWYPFEQSSIGNTPGAAVWPVPMPAQLSVGRLSEV